MRNNIFPISYELARFIPEGANPQNWLQSLSAEIKAVSSFENGAIIQRPRIHEEAYVSPTAVLIGGMIISRGCYVGPYAVIRLDEKSELEPFILGEESNVQDGACIHANVKSVGRRVIIAHHAIVHGAIVEDGAALYIKAVADGCRVGKGCFLDAGCYVGKGVELPENRWVAPGSIVLTNEEAQKLPPVPEAKRAAYEHVIELNLSHNVRYLKMEGGNF